MRKEITEEVDLMRAEIERLNKDLLAQNACCDGAAAQDAHVRREREEHRAEVEKLRSEIERMRDVLRRVVVYPSGDRAARVAFVSVGCQVSFPLHPQTTWALELLVEFDQARRAALEGKP
jgi:hypothetical protein